MLSSTFTSCFVVFVVAGQYIAPFFVRCSSAHAGTPSQTLNTTMATSQSNGITCLRERGRAHA
ncbi:MAG: hypothetical protein JNK05_39055 [Myxococcales bacterium]|nr:hypothetical protein [Myxococcales bacterium]